MKKCVGLLLFSFLITCCTRVNREDFHYLNGYWQIEKVVLANGETKDYSGNTSYDFFEYKAGTGYRQKVMPQLDGTFETNNIRETYTAVMRDQAALLEYKTDYAKWNEEILELDSLHLVVKNAANLEYHYKRAEPINLIDESGQKTK
ncbi:MAG: hypothetical protein EOO01_41760 [Chitinophagaceae bacterium]|nr:MAG: hypothetical protein EOO01_41760 [Chitinophagaceae bacterium]